MSDSTTSPPISHQLSYIILITLAQLCPTDLGQLTFFFFFKEKELEYTSCLFQSLATDIFSGLSLFPTLPCSASIMSAGRSSNHARGARVPDTRPS